MAIPIPPPMQSVAIPLPRLPPAHFVAQLGQRARPMLRTAAPGSMKRPLTLTFLGFRLFRRLTQKVVKWSATEWILPSAYPVDLRISEVPLVIHVSPEEFFR